MARALIGLGANLGDRQGTLDAALRQLAEVPGARLLQRSRWRATRPVGGPPGQGDFLNGAALLETGQSSAAFHAALHAIEAAAGRRRSQRWQARPLDLDLLLWDEEIILTPRLEVPHPGLAFRRFVLEPAAEVAADMPHPRIGWTVGRLLDHLNRAPQYAAILGADLACKRAFAARLAAATGIRLLQGSAGPPQDGVGPRGRRPRSADSPIQSLKQGIELCGQWRRTLAAVGETRAGAGATDGGIPEAGSASDEIETAGETRAALSDFWWDEFPARAAALPERERAVALAIWRAEAADVPVAKLLLVLAPARSAASEASAAKLGPAGRAARRLVSAVLESPGHGPFMHIDAGRPLDDAVQDAAAALQAMR